MKRVRRSHVVVVVAAAAAAASVAVEVVGPAESVIAGKTVARHG